MNDGGSVVGFIFWYLIFFHKLEFLNFAKFYCAAAFTPEDLVPLVHKGHLSSICSVAFSYVEDSEPAALMVASGDRLGRIIVRDALCPEKYSLDDYDGASKRFRGF